MVQAVEAEVATLLSSLADKLTDRGHQRLVRHGHPPEREIISAWSPCAVRVSATASAGTFHFCNEGH
jgi:putative transposase